jgi:alanine racemase
VKSIFSHLAGSDDQQFEDFTHEQFKRYRENSEKLIATLHLKPIRHILNTSGIFHYPEMQMEMVRLGIGLYGIGNSDYENQHLLNVSTLKSIISQIRTVEPGESVGYSRKFMVEKTTKVASIPIGYADGIRRALGNQKSYVLINGQKAVIIGNVCMDTLMTDVTDIACKEGDDVIIFGENPKVIDLAKILNTIPYEILTSISQRVKRVFYKN